MKYLNIPTDCKKMYSQYSQKLILSRLCILLFRWFARQVLLGRQFRSDILRSLILVQLQLAEAEMSFVECVEMMSH